MPIHDHGYRPWNGHLAGRWSRALAITHSGILTAMRVRWTRFLLIAAFAPLIYFGVIFFALGNITAPDTSPKPGLGMLMALVRDPVLMAKIQADPGEVRAPLWNDIFLTLQANAQVALAAAVALIIGPSLISRDVKSRAFLIYFSKPITRVDYLIGKAGVLLAFLGMTVLVPTIVIYGIGIATSPDSATFSQTWSVIPKFLAGAGLMMVPLSILTLLISALNTDERIARFITLVVLLVGEITYRMFDVSEAEQAWPFLLSLPRTIQVAIGGVYDAPILAGLSKLQGGEDERLALAWLGVCSVLGLVVIWRRISAPMRV